jgi:hypothetical protein
MFDRFLYDRKLQPDKPALLRGGVLLSCGVACAFVLSVFHAEAGKFRGLLLLTLATLVTVVAAYVALRLYRSAASSHRIFYGTPLLSGTFFDARRGLSSQKKLYLSLLVVGVVFAPSFVVLSRISGSLEVAAPQRVRRVDDLTPGVLKRLGESAAQNRLPDLAGYVMHRAYQDSLLYNRSWVYPELGGQVAISRFEDENGKIVAKESPVLTYDSDWFTGVFRDAAGDGVGGMLVEQGGNVAVRYRSRSGIMKMMKSIATAVLVIVPVLYSTPSLTTYCIYGMRNLPLRRKRQTA